MLLMIFASRHLSACCSPSFRLQSLLKLINLAQALGVSGLQTGWEHRSVRSLQVHRKGADNSTGAGPAPQNHPPSTPSGPARCRQWRETGCAEQPSLRPAPSAHPCFRERDYCYFFHGKALTLPLRHGASSFGGQDL